MTKAERETRKLISQFPAIRVESRGKSGYVAVASNGQAFRLGSFGSKQHRNGVVGAGDKNLRAWCKKQSGM